jgi:hypothetical protein
MIACDDNDAWRPLSPWSSRLISAELGGTVRGCRRPAASFTVTTGTSTVFDPNSPERKIVTYSISVGDLSGEATGAAIRGPADVSTTAAILVPLTVTSTDTTGLIVSGTFTATANPAVSMDSLLTLLRAGAVYVNVQTDANPLGEIRGQINTVDMATPPTERSHRRGKRR